jgi:hypothetical protein
LGGFSFLTYREDNKMEDLLKLLGSLGGIGALVAALVNIGKTVGWIKDGQAPTFMTGFNLLILILLFALGIFRPQADIAGADQIAGQLAVVLITVFGFVWQLISSRLTHDALKGVPVLGKSYSQAQSSVMKAQASEYLQRTLQRE